MKLKETETIIDDHLLDTDLTDTHRSKLSNFKSSNGFVKEFIIKHRIYNKKLSGFLLF